MKAGIVGASGYAGTELLRLLSAHPELEPTIATANTWAGEDVATHTPSLAGTYPGLRYQPTTAGVLAGLDVVFVALPHGESQRLVPELIGRVGAVVDLAADFRLHDPALYPAWYGVEHACPELLGRFAYGLPELFRRELAAASSAPAGGTALVAVPGCYPTAAALALSPLVRAGAVAADGLVVDAASGVSGAGRTPSDALHFGTVDGGFCAYGLLSHRHTPEMEQALGCGPVLFTPHLAPMSRGILATCYARPPAGPGKGGAGGGLDTAAAMALLHRAYDDEPFVVVVDEPPSTKSVAGSNSAQVTVRVDDRTGWVVSLCAIDNLVKGAAGQALQCANLVLGLDETAGLPRAGMFP